VEIGGPACVVMAGPCAVEARGADILPHAHVKAAGAKVLRGGAVQGRAPHPIHSRGYNTEGLDLLKTCR